MSAVASKAVILVGSKSDLVRSRTITADGERGPHCSVRNDKWLFRTSTSLFPLTMLRDNFFSLEPIDFIKHLIVLAELTIDFAAMVGTTLSSRNQPVITSLKVLIGARVGLLHEIPQRSNIDGQIQLPHSVCGCVLMCCGGSSTYVDSDYRQCYVFASECQYLIKYHNYARIALIENLNVIPLR